MNKYKVTYDFYGSNKEVPLYSNHHNVYSDSEENACKQIKSLVGGSNHKAELIKENTMKQTLGQLLESLSKKELLIPGNYIDSEGVKHSSNKNEFDVIDGKSPSIVAEDSLTLASFLEGNPIAKDAVNAAMDLIWRGNHAEALAYLEKNHQDIKDQVMSLIYLQPHIAALHARQTHDPSEFNGS